MAPSDHHHRPTARSSLSIDCGVCPTTKLAGEPCSPLVVGRLTPLEKSSLPPSRSTVNFVGSSNFESRGQTLNSQRVGAILKNFKFFQDLDASVLQKLPSIAQHVRYSAGTILFRQGDPPGSCYAILSGEVGIFVKSEEEDKVDSARASPTARRTGLPLESPSTVQRNTSSSLRRADSLTDNSETNSLNARSVSVEGFSTYHDGSILGKRCSVFGPGKLFGELALMQSVPRSATIKCLKDSEFLVICRREFDQVLKDELAQANSRKNKFLHDHVPGMRDLPPVKQGCNRPHASYFFKKASFCKDHEFLTQGMCQEDTLFVIIRGSVELRRYETPGRKLPSRRNRRAMKSWTPSQQVTQDGEDEVPEKEDYVRKMGIMLAGSVFGSLPMAEPEPFTVVASSLCEAYYVSGQDFMKLPRSLINSIQEHLANTVTWRLARLKSDRCIKLKESPVNMEDASNLSMSAKNYGLKLMQVGKIHPHPVLLKSSAVQPKDLIKKRTASTGLSSSESLPSMSQQTSVQLSQFSQTASMMSRGSLKGSGMMQRPATVNGPVRAWDK